MIPSPMKDEPYDDRETDCEMALEMKVDELVDECALVGWTRSEAMAAIVNVPSTRCSPNRKRADQLPGQRHWLRSNIDPP